MKANKRILLFSVSLLVPVAIIAPFVTSCGCSGNTGNFKDLVYGQQTPDITKDTKDNARNAAILHFVAQYDSSQIGNKDGTIKKSDFDSQFSGYSIVCTDYYWNLIYYFANICQDKDVYQIVDWNANAYHALTIQNEITLKNKDGNYTLSAHPSDTFKYGYDADELDRTGSAVINITLATDAGITIPSYLAARITVIKD